MLRTLHVFFGLLGFLISIEPRYWKIKSLEKKGDIEKKDEILLKTSQTFAKRLLGRSKIDVEVDGIENVPSDGKPYILTPNHSSYLDIPVLFKALGTVIGFVSKTSNKKMPFIGRWMPLVYSVYIDRTSPRDAVRSLNEGAKIIKEGHPQVIFPEGTRSESGELLEFKAGSYKLAKKAGALVIPVAIIGAYDCLKKGSFIVKSGKVKVKFFEPLDNELDTSEMAELSRNLIEKELKRAR